MQKLERAVKMPPCDDTLCKVASIMVKDHVFPMVDMRIKTLFGCHKFMQLIEKGFIRIYGVYSNNGFCGFCYGRLQEDNETFEVHVMFDRHIDVVQACKLCKEVMAKDYALEGHEVKYTVGYIPSYNRGAMLMAKRYGCEDLGECDITIIGNDLQAIKCHKMRARV